mgnify:CR=1 FL=1
MIKNYQKFLDIYTEFIFIEHIPKDCDMIFLPGNAYPEVGIRAAELYRGKDSGTYSRVRTIQYYRWRF